MGRSLFVNHDQHLTEADDSSYDRLAMWQAHREAGTMRAILARIEEIDCTHVPNSPGSSVATRPANGAIVEHLAAKLVS